MYNVRGIDCYGEIKKGMCIEVIINSNESYLVNNNDFATWFEFVNWLLDIRGYYGVVELVADK